MKHVVFYARPWTVELFLAIEKRWRDMGIDVDVRYLTQQLWAWRRLTDAGAHAVFLPRAVEALDVPDPIATLEEIERRYGDALLPLARYVMAERFFKARERSWQLEQLARYATFFDDLFRTFRPGLLIGESPDIMPAWLANDMAPPNGCEPVGLMPSTIPPGRLLMLRNHREIPGVRESYESFRRGHIGEAELAAARALQAAVLGAGTKLDYLPPRRHRRDFLIRLAKGSVVREQLAFSFWQLRERFSGNWFFEPNPILWALRGRLRALRARLADRRYLTDRLSGRPFVFFPLHFEPEATTLVHGSYFENQKEVVRNLARSVPAGWDLVVKEHFFMRGARELAFYRELREIPNVRLMPFSVPTNRLILDARVVAVIASTTGLEASFIGKPVVMFGDYPWDYSPMVRKVGALADLPGLIVQAANGELGPDHPDVLAFAASWDAALPRGRYYRSRQYDWLERGNVAAIADALSARENRHSMEEGISSE